MRIGAVVVPLNIAYEAPEIEDAVRRSKAEYLFAMRAFRGAAFEQRLLAVDPTCCDGSTAVGLPLPRLSCEILPTSPDERLEPDSDSYRRIFGGEGSRALDAFGPVSGNDPAIVLFTSGSTAKPKPTLFPHGGIVGCATALCYSLGVDETDRVDRLRAQLPRRRHDLDTVAAPPRRCHVLRDALRARPHPRGNGRRRITVFNGMDTHFTKLFNSPLWNKADVTSVVKGNVGCTPSFMRRVEGAFSYRRIAQIHGSTESLGVLSITPREEEDVEVIRETNGKPLPGMDVAILDPETGAEVAVGQPGEICFRLGPLHGVRGPTCRVPDRCPRLLPQWRLRLARCRRQPLLPRPLQADDPDGRGERGRARDRDLPRDRHPGNHPCRSRRNAGRRLGRGNRRLRADGGRPGVFPDELRERCRGKIAAFKIPKRFVVLAPDENWPMLGSGRTDKPALRARARALAPAASMDDSYSVRREAGQGDTGQGDTGRRETGQPSLS